MRDRGRREGRCEKCGEGGVRAKVTKRGGQLVVESCVDIPIRLSIEG